MKMMGVLTIDNVEARLAFEFYYRGMTLASEIQKSPARLDKDRTSQVDPPLGNKLR